MTDAPEDARLTDHAELLFRQVHPSWIRDDELTSQAFKPTAKDEGHLSVSRGALTTAAEAFELHTGPKGFAAIGTWAVSVEEVGAEAEGVRGMAVYGDPVTEPVRDDAHAYIDFRGRSRKETETKAMLLRVAARARGRRHP